MDRLTGLGIKRSRLALKRKGSLIFLASGGKEAGKSEVDKLNFTLERYGIKVTRGGRFYHLIPADCGKDSGVKKIIEYYRKNDNKVSVTGAAGDSFNDIPMLKEVDYPYIVKKSDSTWTETDFTVLRTENQGPCGFTEAVKDFLMKTAGL
jgi:mannosyl-3-phosphoglycerate phosphatase